MELNQDQKAALVIMSNKLKQKQVLEGYESVIFDLGEKIRLRNEVHFSNVSGQFSLTDEEIDSISIEYANKKYPLSQSDKNLARLCITENSLHNDIAYESYKDAILSMRNKLKESV